MMNKENFSATSARAQRKFLRGAIADAGFRGGELEDSLPPDAFVGERVIAFVAESSWFMYCYTCSLEDSCGHAQASRPDR
jgi:hypothetical protein